ncbi:PucR family transcriptional regulator [Amycolatopsis nigrescens]|uniref:PucR family transcriptional regulator n=1 Tax=Amycolatopsis nigrescens TaxID=381445 RepID=UPI00036EA6ED|nr:helix-turn-helix domain-containing protein [Amycolatopsis nigrescens]
MNRTPSPQALTVDALVHYGPLADTRALIDEHFDQPVPHVALVSDLDQIRSCTPHTAVVLHQSLAQGVWAVESAMRLAWERAAACVITPALPGIGESTAQLALRLRTPVFVVTDDSAQCALDLAAAITNPDAVRAKLVARCAVLFGERTSARAILGVINSEVPGVTAALVCPSGHVLAGRATAANPPADRERVQVEVPGPDGRSWASLVADIAGGSGPLLETTETILRLARVPLAATVARERLDLVHDSARATAALDALLAPSIAATPGLGAAEQQAAGNGQDGPAIDMGWRVHGRHVALFLRTTAETALDVESASPGVISAWQQEFGDRPLVPRATGWASWWPAEEATAEDVATELRHGLNRMRSPVGLVAGIGEPADRVPGLRESLAQAELASAAAQAKAAGHIELFAELGERLVLACLPVVELARSAGVALAGLLAAPDHRTLVATLAAVLDHGGSTGQAAAQLGVHRNTVLGRLERIRAHGVDLDRADRRLALHLASYALNTSAPLPPD